MVEIGGRGATEVLGEITRRVNDTMGRLRIMEERLRNLDTRVNTIDQNFLNEIKRINKSLADATDSIKMIQDRIVNMEVDVSSIKRDLKGRVTRGEVKEIESYIELIKPVTTKFVTRKEVEEMISTSHETHAEVE